MLLITLINLSDPRSQSILGSWSRGEDFRQKPQRQLARAILRSMVVELTGTPSESWSFYYEPSGRPRLQSQDSTVGAPEISISHSGSWVACAMSPASPVGIDVECHRGDRNISGIAGASFGPGERARVDAGGVEAFYRVWTAREAVAKLTGKGLAQVLDQIDYADIGPEEGTWSAVADGQDLTLSHVRPEVGLSLSTATMAPATLQPQWWTF